MSQPWPDLWFDLPIAALDVETTGFDENEDRIIEVGVVRFLRGELVDSHGWLLDPGRPIPESVIALTGIRNEDVAGKPVFGHIAQELVTLLEGHGIVAYNLPFDRKFVTTALQREGLGWPEHNPTFDPLILARQFHRDEGSKRLGEVAARLGIDLVEAHRAVDDAAVAGRVLYAFREVLPPRLEDLLVLQVQWEQQQRQQMQSRHPGRRFDDEGAFLGNTSKLVGLGPGYIYGTEADPLRALFASVPEARRED
ncbi:MAG: 3'-5' exonuclease [Myxococcota bacterium]|nr:3'-5' exonuclease [Myxococcota bacterium]